MTEKTTNSAVVENTASDYHKLSIQVSLNGLSFCVLDTISNELVASERLLFDKELIPYQIEKRLRQFFEEHQVVETSFSEVVVIHKNNLFNLVPKALFDETVLANYLKFNAKILANDHIAYDEIESRDMVNVYVPFMNINNYIYDLFGEFEFMHSGTVMVQSLINSHNGANEPVCYVHVAGKQMDITVIIQKKLVLYNSFNFTTQEDFIYYLLFVLEQLKLDTETIKLKLFGEVDEGGTLYDLCYEYVKDISIFIPSTGSYHLGNLEDDSIDFTVLNAL